MVQKLDIPVAVNIFGDNLSMDDPFEVKLDRAIAFLQGVKDIPTVMRIMDALKIRPTGGLDVTNRRALTRALTNYLNDESRLADPEIDQQCDQIILIQREYFQKSRETMGKIKTEQPAVRLRDQVNDGIDIPGLSPDENEEELLGAAAAPPGHQYNPIQYNPMFDLLAGGVDLLGLEEEIGDGNIPVIQQIPILHDVRGFAAQGAVNNDDVHVVGNDVPAAGGTPGRPIPPPRVWGPGLNNVNPQNLINALPDVPGDNVPFVGVNAAPVAPAHVVVAPPLPVVVAPPAPVVVPHVVHPPQNYVQQPVVGNVHPAVNGQYVQPHVPVYAPLQPVQPVAHPFFHGPPVPANIPVVRAPNPFVPVSNLIPGIPPYVPRPRMAAAALLWG